MPPRKPAPPCAGALAGHLFRQHPGQQQVDLSVKVDIPGSWFSAGQLGSLTSAEKKDKYEGVAVEYDEKHVFAEEDKAKKKPAKIGKGIRFLCHSDAADDAEHTGFWMELAVWNRYRHDTYKDPSKDEVRCCPARRVTAIAAACCIARALSSLII